MFAGIAAGVVVGVVTGIVANHWIVFFLVPIFAGLVAFLSYKFYAVRKIGTLRAKIVNVSDMSIDRETFEMLDEMGQDVSNIESQIQKISSLKRQLMFMLVLPVLATLLAELVIYALKISFFANAV
jgi:hypothetical protein